MGDKLTRYRNLDYTLPETYLSWELYGAGLENLGKDNKPVELPLRDPEPDEILCRVDALGLCFSDTKLIWAGPEHPRIRGRDLQADPTVAGHEAALTVVKVGSQWQEKFAPGQRYIIQADIFIHGEQKAFGYVQRGAMAQYTYCGPWVLDGDDGCYLLPIQDSSGYAESALVEPWACVESAYHIQARTTPEPGGCVLVVFAESKEVDFNGLYAAKEARAAAVIGDYCGDLTPVLGNVGSVKRLTPDSDAIAQINREVTDGAGFDDIVLVGNASAELIQACDQALHKNGYLAFVAGTELPDTALDIGRVHYHYTRHVATKGSRVLDAYTANTRSDLKEDGTCWMIGAAGPMGQMHVQRALEHRPGPAKIFCTDISQERLDYMAKRLRPIAARMGVELVIRNVSDTAGLDDELTAFTDGKGFDDIYVHAPVAPLVSHSAHHVAEGCVLNVFAGVALGTEATLPMSMFLECNTRLIGSSGSAMSDFVGVLNKMESSKLATRMSVAAIGGIEATHAGIAGVKGNRYPGKTIIYPHIQGMDLATPDELHQACPEAASALENGNVWTNEAEDALLEARLNI